MDWVGQPIVHVDLVASCASSTLKLTTMPYVATWETCWSWMQTGCAKRSPSTWTQRAYPTTQHAVACVSAACSEQWTPRSTTGTRDTVGPGSTGCVGCVRCTTENYR